MPEKKKNTKRDKAMSNYTLFQRLRSGAWVKWRRDSQQSYDFSLGDQLTKQELDDLKHAGMPTFTVDKISQSIEVLKYFITANNPEFQAIGTELSDDRLAKVHQAVLKHIMYISGFKGVFGNVVNDALTKSVGFLMCYIDPDLDNGNGEVVIKSLNPWDVYVDPSTVDIMYRDAEYILIHKVFTKNTLVNMLPQFKSKILNAKHGSIYYSDYSGKDSDNSNSIQPWEISNIVDKEGSTEERIDYYEKYFKKRVQYWTITLREQLDETQMERVNKQIEADLAEYQQALASDVEDKSIEINDALKRGDISKERAQFELKKLQEQAAKAVEQRRNELVNQVIAAVSKTEIRVVSDDEYKILIKNKDIKERIVNAVQYWETRIGVIASVGGDTFLYEATLPISEYPIVPVPYTHTGTPYPMSAVRKVVGKQQEVNKTHQLMVYNATLGSSLRWLHEKGAIPNEDEWDATASIPGSRLEYNKGFTPPVPVQPMQLSTAFYEIATKGERDIEEGLGVSPFSMGTEVPAHIPYRGMLQWDEASTRRIRAWVTNTLEPALEHFGKVVTQLAQYHYDTEKVIRLVDPDTNNVEEYKINVPVYDSLGSVVSRYNDYQSTRFDIRIVSGSTLPRNRRMEAAEVMEYYKLGAVDDIALLTTSTIPDKEAIIARKSMYAHLKGINDALEKQVKEMAGTIETLKRQLVQAGIKVKVKEVDAELSKIVSDHKAALRAAEARYRMELRAAGAEAKHNAKNKEVEEKAKKTSNNK